MSAAQVAPHCLTQVLGGLFRANAGQICLTLSDAQGNTDFDLTHCEVRDTTVKPSAKVANDSLTAKRWCFTLVAGKQYSLQLVCAQIPAIGSDATLLACGTPVMVITSANQIQAWTVQS